MEGPMEALHARVPAQTPTACRSPGPPTPRPDALDPGADWRAHQPEKFVVLLSAQILLHVAAHYHYGPDGRTRNGVPCSDKEYNKSRRFCAPPPTMRSVSAPDGCTRPTRGWCLRRAPRQTEMIRKE